MLPVDSRVPSVLDYLIAGGTVVDGTGAPGRQAQVGVRDGKVVAVGEVDESAARTIDASGLVVCPGFIDVHTHYDAQLTWDPYATPSCFHGVTTVIGGGTGPAEGTKSTTVTPGSWYLARMLAALDSWPVNVALLGKGNTVAEEALWEQLRGGAAGLAACSDWASAIGGGGGGGGSSRTTSISSMRSASLRTV